ncbi:MAG: bifunctional (p)ppGpp synthetase/guanosine-3',5'-bis(diphosphate) 3'-pyrophosphohydrolase [Thermodesulfobacteriota bacterium]
MTNSREPSITIDDLLNRTQGYLPADQVPLLEEAYGVAKAAHLNHLRPSGEPYINHVLSVAQILAAMRLDRDTLISGLLHGTLKYPDTGIDEKFLTDKFGADVARIVRGTTRIDKVRFNSQIDYQAENIRKMLLAMSSDIRVLLVKLADRLNDMQLQDFPEDKAKEYARETMDLYAPLASRLGIDWLKRELEDRAFGILHPEEHHDLEERISSSLHDRERYVKEVKKLLSEKLHEYGIFDFSILGRPKHLYSIYKKLLKQQIPLEKVYDKVAFRIILKTVRECYQALGMVHAIWPPIEGRIKDYISQPKTNMYQSLHTSVIGPSGEFMEIQIRTDEMDKIAKEGIAAHWAYKEGATITEQDASSFQWLKQLVNWLQELKDPQEFLETVKDELHRDAKTYVLTPTGEVKELPGGATPLDFAYSIHTEVGNHCVGAKINGTIAPLKTPLRNGNVVEIMTSPRQQPNQGWLKLAKTSRAKSRIRHWLRQDELQKFSKLGEELCERELKKQHISLKKLIKTGHLKTILQKLHCNSLSNLFVKVGEGTISTSQISEILLPPELVTEPEPELAPSPETKGKRPEQRPTSDEVITIDGVDGVLMRISQCCLPMPGDEVMGFITNGRGISVHKRLCPNLLATDPARWIRVKWNEVKVNHRAQISIIAHDHKGVLGELCNTISEADANIANIDANISHDNLASLTIIVEVSGLDHLQRILQRLHSLDYVLEAKRV